MYIIPSKSGGSRHVALGNVLLGGASIDWRTRGGVVETHYKLPGLESVISNEQENVL